MTEEGPSELRALAILSIANIFKDIIPGYRIAEKAEDEHVSKGISRSASLALYCSAMRYSL